MEANNCPVCGHDFYDGSICKHVSARYDGDTLTIREHFEAATNREWKGEVMPDELEGA